MELVKMVSMTNIKLGFFLQFDVNFFLLTFCTHFLFNNVIKKVVGIFFFFFWILSHLQELQKLKQTWFIHSKRNQVLYFF